MFSSSITNNEIPFHIPSSFFGNQDDIFSHQDVAAQDHFSFPNVAIGNVANFPPLDNFDPDIPIKHDHYKNDVALEENVPLICDPLLISLLRPRWKKPDAVINKHRHRKIVTAQGSRDRRVRLSIQIARRFFDLQDNLGYDKASETIDWLLTQSKPAIEEIAKIKQRHCTFAAELEKDIEAAEMGDSFKRNSSVSSNSTGSAAKEIGISMHQHSDYLAKELRAKARERARERTKAKMSAKKIIELRYLGCDFGPIIPNSWNQYNRSREMSHSIAESLLTTRNLNAPQNFTANQQMFTSSRQVPSSSTTIAENNRGISNNFSTIVHQQQDMGATCTTEDTAYMKNKI